MTLIDTLIVFLYLGAMVGMGFFLSRRSRQGSDAFMAASRCLPGWAVGLSIFGTYVSSISFLANPGKSYAGNWNPFVFGLSLPVAAWVAVKWFVPFYRKIGEVSAYHHFEKRFGLWARIYAVFCFLLMQVARMGTIMFLVAMAVEPLTGWDVRLIIIGTGILVTIYTLLGGIEAVIWTDAIQSVVLTLGALISCVILLNGMPEGPGQVFRIAAEHDKFSLGSYGLSLAEPTFWVVLTYGLFINLQNFGIDQSYVQRYITAKSDKDAARSVWMGALMFLPISALLFFVGTALFAFYTAQPELLPAGDIKADAVFPHFIGHHLPVGVTGFLLAAILAAAMSSVDSSLNSSATLIHCDIYKRIFKPDATEKESMKVLSITTVVWGIAGTAMALAMIQVKTALDAWWQLAGIFSGGMLGLFLLGMICRRAGNPAALTGAILGMIVIFWMSLSTTDLWPESLAALRNPFHGFMTIVFGTLTILLAGILISRFKGRPETSLENPYHDK